MDKTEVKKLMSLVERYVKAVESVANSVELIYQNSTIITEYYAWLRKRDEESRDMPF